MNDFKKNWEFSESYMNDIREILKANSAKIVRVEVADPDDDMKKSTDLKIKITAGDVAVRIRRAFQHYRDLTIRAKNGNSKTELHKLREGYADWYLYLWTDDSGICDWILVNINKMRKSGLLEDETRPVKMNKDGYTGFVVYGLKELQKIDAIVSRRTNQ